MSNQNKTPWHVVEGRAYGSIEVFGGDTPVAELWRRGDAQQEKAIAQRIVACVNACEGFTLEELQGVALCKNRNETEVEIGELRKQRDELVTALRVALNALEEISGEMTVGDRFTNAGQYMIDALPIARAAMKKIGGEV